MASNCHHLVPRRFYTVCALQCWRWLTLFARLDISSLGAFFLGLWEKKVNGQRLMTLNLSRKNPDLKNGVHSQPPAIDRIHEPKNTVSNQATGTRKGHLGQSSNATQRHPNWPVTPVASSRVHRAGPPDSLCWRPRPDRLENSQGVLEKMSPKTKGWNLKQS